MRVSTVRIEDDAVPPAATSPNRGDHRVAWLLRRAIAIGLFWAVVLSIALPGRAQNVDQGAINREYQIKAAFLYNFGHDAYVRWPAEALGSESDPFVIGILGNDPFGTALREIAQHKKVKGRKLVVRRFATMEDYDHCHILFISRSQSRQQRLRAIRGIAGHHVLLVGESPGFAQDGGAINFYIEQNKLRFEINLESARNHELTISSRLLSVARVIDRP